MSLFRLFVSPRLIATVAILASPLISPAAAATPGGAAATPSDIAAAATPSDIAARIPDARPVGAGSVFYADIIKVYSATLYAPEGDWRRDKPFALDIEYAVPLSTGQQVKVIFKAMAKVFNRLDVMTAPEDKEKIAEWRRILTALLPDVSGGDRVVAIYNDGDASAHFYVNGREAGIVDDPEFSHWFFGLWLDETAPNRDLRRQLLGAS